MGKLSFLFLMLLSIGLYAQPNQSPSLDSLLGTFSDKEKVEYVNKHFYEIYSGDFTLAKELTRKAIAISSANNWKLRQAYSQMNFGIVTYMKGEYEESLAAYLAAESLFDSLDNADGKALLFIEMANYYQKNGYGDKKYTYLDSAEKYSLITPSKFALAKSYGMRASFLYQDGEVEKARGYYLKNYEAYKELDEKVGLGYVLLDLANYAQMDGDLQAAISYVDESTQIRVSLEDTQGISENLLFLGDLYRKEGDYVKAHDYYFECINVAKEMLYPDLERKAMARISDTYRTLGDFEKALSYSDSARLLEIKLFNLERAKTIDGLQTKYETAKKEQKILTQEASLLNQKSQLVKSRFLIFALISIAVLILLLSLLFRFRLKRKQELILKKQEITNKEEQLKAIIHSQEDERKRFASDLHDGFGQLITLLKMNVNSIGDPSKNHEEKTVHFNRSSEILNGMYDELRGICFNLMPHTLVKKGLVEALEELISRVNYAGGIILSLQVFDIEGRFDELKEISIYRVVQEWVNNILKYSNAEHVTIQLTRDDREMTLIIEDDGSGFDPSLLTEGNGNGWKNINSRTQLIGGEVFVETQKNAAGSTLILNVPYQFKAVASPA